MEPRDSFVLYRSVYEAVEHLKKQDKATVILAVCDYALNGNLQPLTGVPAAMFALIRPNLDANQKRYLNGKKGGRPASERKPSWNQTITENEPNELCIMSNALCVMPTDTPTVPSGDFAAVASAYLNRINPSASQGSLDELKAFCETLGPDVCMRAFDIALDEKKAGWSYIRGILRRLSSQGVKCLADWDALETQRTTRKEQPTYQGKVPMGCSGELTDMEKDAIKRLFEEYGDAADG